MIELLVKIVYDGSVESMYGRIADHGLVGACVVSLLFAPFAERRERRNDECPDEFLFSTCNDRLLDEPRFFQFIFNGGRSHIFTSACFKQFFLAVGDAQKFPVLQYPDIAGMKP